MNNISEDSNSDHSSKVESLAITQSDPKILKNPTSSSSSSKSLDDDQSRGMTHLIRKNQGKSGGIKRNTQLSQMEKTTNSYAHIVSANELQRALVS